MFDEQQVVMTEKQVAEYLNLTPRALQDWRYRGCGPAFIRISARCIRYRRSDIDKWLADRVAHNTVEQTKAEQDFYKSIGRI